MGEQHRGEDGEETGRGRRIEQRGAQFFGAGRGCADAGKIGIDEGVVRNRDWPASA